MRWSHSLIATLREAPQEAEIESHVLLLRAGMIRRLAAGLYTFLPLGMRVLRKIEGIVREEMNRAGALEILMPALQPEEIWERSDRLHTMGPAMFSLHDRQQRTLILGPTHEEVVTALAARELQSYRQLPCTLYQIQTKFRDEIRPRFGLMRAKEFIMKDAYSFDGDAAGAEASYQAMRHAYQRFFDRCGLKTRVVEADSGDMGGSASHEFMVLAAAGEDGLLECAACGYAANQERAERRAREADATPVAGEAGSPAPEPVSTPGVTTIEAVSGFLSVPPSLLIKTCIFNTDNGPVAILVEGDRDVNEPKAKQRLGTRVLQAADAQTVVAVSGCAVGFAGPTGLSIPVYADEALRNARDRIAGANRTDTHLRHVSIERDARVTDYADLVVVRDGDACPRCGQVLRMQRGIEVGHVFKLGRKYTEAFEAACLDAEGERRTLIMGCYGIGVSRTLQAIVEQSRDEAGIVWPVSVAPYTVDILCLDPADPACMQAASDVQEALEAHGIDAILDDRDERPGVKFKDADLVGFPVRVVVGSRSLARGGVEVKSRTSTQSRLVPTDQATAEILSLIQALQPTTRTGATA